MEKITAEIYLKEINLNNTVIGTDRDQTLRTSDAMEHYAHIKSQSDNRELVEKIEIMIREYEGRRDYEKGFNDTKYLFYNRVAHDLKKLIS